MNHKLNLSNGEQVECSKIICIARNYSEHIKELNNSAPPRPTFFMKPNTALVSEGQRVLLPDFSDNVHHEVELAVLIGRDGHRIEREDAMDYIAGYGIAVDLTARDLQSELKESGHPWEMAKAFDHACPVSAMIPKDQVGDVSNLDITLSVNGELRQSGNTSQMIHDIPAQISAMSQYFTLLAGDLLLTGTPKGVGPLSRGDVMVASIENIGECRFELG